MWDVGLYQVLAEDKINQMLQEAARERLAKEAAAQAASTRPALAERVGVIVRALLPRQPDDRHRQQAPWGRRL